MAPKSIEKFVSPYNRTDKSKTAGLACGEHKKVNDTVNHNENTNNCIWNNPLEASVLIQGGLELAGTVENGVGSIFNQVIFGGQQEAVEEAPAHEIEEEPQTEDEKNEAVKALFTGTDIELTDAQLADVVKKYDAIKAVKPDITDDELTTRLTKYIDGAKHNGIFSQWGLNFIEDKVGNTQITVGTTKDDYRKLAENLIEYHNIESDDSGEKIMSFNEFVYAETKKPISELTEDEKEALQMMFDKINMGSKDDGITVNDYATYLSIMSIIDDNEKSTFKTITEQEFNATQSGLTLNDEQMNNLDKCGISDKAYALITAFKEQYNHLPSNSELDKISGLNECDKKCYIAWNAANRYAGTHQEYYNAFTSN